MKKLPKDISELDARIQAAKSQKKSAVSHKYSKRALLVQNALQVSIEFVSPVFIGVCMGYMLDKWFDTRALFMLIMTIFGCVAGILNLYRTAQSIEKNLDGSE